MTSMPPELPQQIYADLQAERRVDALSGYLGQWEHLPKSVQAVFETVARSAWKRIGPKDAKGI